jgi:hypothetical protein
MALAYNMRRTTADVDGVFEPKAVIYETPRDRLHGRGEVGLGAGRGVGINVGGRAVKERRGTGG